MKPSDVNLGRQLNGTFSFLSSDISKNVEKAVVSLSSEENSDAALITFKDGRSCTISAVDRNARHLIEEARYNKASFSWIVSIQSSILMLQMHIFPTIVVFPAEEPLKIGVTDAISQDIPKSWKGKSIEYLKQKFLLEDMLFAAYYAKSNFVLIGGKRGCDIEIDLHGIPKCRKIRSKPRNLNTPVTILKGAIEFVDSTLARSANLILNQLKDAVYGAESYLNTWEVYNELEEQLRKKEAVELGAIGYTKYEMNMEDDNILYTFFLTNDVPPALQKGDEMDTSSEHFLEEGEEIVFPQNTVYVGEVYYVHKKIVKVKIDNESWSPEEVPPLNGGYLLRSLRGDQIRLDRRKRALEKIREIRTPLHTLGLLLEKGNALVPEGRHNQAFSEGVRKALGYRLTPSQLAALDRALNTPDIALIQGPPGTGKTTVIRALMARLSELSEKRSGDKAEILVSSDQHEAVDNALKGLNISDLPPNRIGGKRGESHEKKTGRVWNWIRQQERFYAEILKKERPITKTARDVDRLIFQWRNTRGGAESLVNLVQNILTITGPYLDQDLLEDLRQASLQTSQQYHRSGLVTQQAENADLLQQVELLLKSQRTEFVSFQDDGPFQAQRLLNFLQRSGTALSVTIPEILHKAAKSDMCDALPEQQIKFFDDFRIALATLEQQGCNNYRGCHQQPLSMNLDKVLTNVSEAMHRQALQGTDGTADAIQSFCEEIQDEEAVQLMIKKYAGIVGATCQQTVARRYGMEDREYDLVIIDEAAHANPLDLLIPMSLGKRIVLVGDHKQLPHILEEEIVEKFKQGKDKQIVEFLQKSLFERLFERFREVEEQTGIKRAVTLLDDFRMHPTISQFVKNAFYPRDNIVPQCSTEEREHQLNMYGNSPVCWIDVPKAKGLEALEQSKSRLVEAEIIMSEIEKILQKNKESSIGIITFYKAQVGLIQEKLETIPVWQKENDRILVGTVDAFQGREFDIVFLSVVRSNNERDLKKRVGFLTSENRLCVALSRAKRLLVVVGDAETVVGKPQEPIVKTLQDFYNLCQSSQGWYESR